MRPIAMIALPLLLSVAVTADTLYRCQDAAGHTTFADKPCSSAAEVVELEVQRPSATQQRDAQSRAAETIAISDALMRERERQRELAREAEIRFRQEQQRQAELERERERERAALLAELKRERERERQRTFDCDDIRDPASVGYRRPPSQWQHERPPCRQRTPPDFTPPWPPSAHHQAPSGLRPLRPDLHQHQHQHHQHQRRPPPRQVPSIQLIIRPR